MNTKASWQTYRTVVLDADVESYIDKKENSAGRFFDQWLGLEWLLCRTPQIGTPRSSDLPRDFLLHVVAGDENFGLEEIWVLYSYDEGVVTVHAIKSAND